MLGDHVAALDDDLAFLGADFQDLALFAFILAAEDDDFVAGFYMNFVGHSPHLHQRTSGARERIFM